MKKLLWLSVTTLMLVIFCGCANESDKNISAEVETSQITTESELLNSTEGQSIEEETTSDTCAENSSSEKQNEVVEIKNQELEENSTESYSMKKEPAQVPISEEDFVGEFNSYWTDKPDLEIQKNADGTYAIQVGIVDVMWLYNCVGEYTEDGLVFSTNEVEGKEISGTITLKYDNAMIATVTLDGSDWSYSNIYEYIKVSDIPNINVQE